jgi:hypothetical protein
MNTISGILEVKLVIDRDWNSDYDNDYDGEWRFLEIIPAGVVWG